MLVRLRGGPRPPPHGTVVRPGSQAAASARPGRRRLRRPRGAGYSPAHTMSDNVIVARHGAIATVTLNRPERRNSLSDPMLTDLGAAFATLRDDASTRVVIVTGAPPMFSAGADAGLKSS